MYKNKFIIIKRNIQNRGIGKKLFNFQVFIYNIYIILDYYTIITIPNLRHNKC